MAYTITLTADERRAIDWIGYRYAHGNDLCALLCEGTTDRDDEEYVWDYPGDVTFSLPEHVAWQIANVIDVDGLICFSDELRSKLYHFQAQIV
jgi:hypothetical protein